MMKLTRAEVRAASGKRPKKTGAGPSDRPHKKKKRSDSPKPVPGAPSAEEHGKAGVELSVDSAPQSDLPLQIEGVQPTSPGGSEKDDVVLALRFPGALPAGPKPRGAGILRPMREVEKDPGPAPADKGKQPIEIEGDSEETRSPQKSERFEELEGSGFSDASLATDMLKATILDSDWEKTIKHPVGEIRKLFYRDVLKTIHWGTALDECLTDLCVKLQKERDSALTDKELATQINGTLSKQIVESGAKIDALRRSLESKEDEVTGLSSALDEQKKIEEDLKEQVEVQRARAVAAEERFAEAQKATKAACERAVLAEQNLKESADRANQAITAAQKQAARAVEEFRTSAAYRADVIKSGSFSYKVGSLDLYRHISESFPHLDLSDFKPEFSGEDEEDSGSSESGSEVEKTAPAIPMSEEVVAEVVISEVKPDEVAGTEVMAEVTPSEVAQVEPVGTASAGIAVSGPAAEGKEASSEELVNWTP